MKYLSVLRHAEAEHGKGINGDYSRILSSGGRNQLTRLAENLKKRNTNFDLLLSSSSKRTVQTTEIISAYVAINEISFDENIYEAEMEELLQCVNELNEAHRSVLLVGHNPGVSSLITYITGGSYQSLQPGMMAMIEINGDQWKQIGRGTGSLKEVLQ